MKDPNFKFHRGQNNAKEILRGAYLTAALCLYFMTSPTVGDCDRKSLYSYLILQLPNLFCEICDKLALIVSQTTSLQLCRLFIDSFFAFLDLYFCFCFFLDFLTLPSKLGVQLFHWSSLLVGAQSERLPPVLSVWPSWSVVVFKLWMCKTGQKKNSEMIWASHASLGVPLLF